MTDQDTSIDADETPTRLSISAMAVASFALSLASLALIAVPALAWLTSILAVTFGHTGRREIKSGARSGWGYDIAGLIIGYVALTILVLAALAARRR